MRVLCFTMAAPVAAMGATGTGLVRPTWSRPARSMVLGLVGACLGLARSDEDALMSLESDLGMALLVENPGNLMLDYHTVTVAPGPQPYARRAEELAQDRLATIVTSREYRLGVVHHVALWERGEATRWPLDRIAAALLEPVFTPYFGRKCCPLGMPLIPHLTEAEQPLAALLAYQRLPDTRALLPRMRPGYVAMDHEDARRFGLGDDNTARVESRADTLLSRARWQFAPREEAILSIRTSENAP